MQMERKEILVSAEEMERQNEFKARILELPHRPKSYHVVTYGCQMNAHDSEKIAGMLAEMGMEHGPARPTPNAASRPGYGAFKFIVVFRRL